jgi:hypothetical protein
MLRLLLNAQQAQRTAVPGHHPPFRVRPSCTVLQSLRLHLRICVLKLVPKTPACAERGFQRKSLAPGGNPSSRCRLYDCACCDSREYRLSCVIIIQASFWSLLQNVNSWKSVASFKTSVVLALNPKPLLLYIWDKA